MGFVSGLVIKRTTELYVFDMRFPKLNKCLGQCFRRCWKGIVRMMGLSNFTAPLLDQCNEATVRSGTESV